MYKHVRYIRTSVSIPVVTMKWLQGEAARLGIPMSDAIRRILDQARGASEKDRTDAH